MTSVTFGDLFKEERTSLRVPENTEAMTPLEAALNWAESGFYVLPIDHKSKNPGSVVGAGWPGKSSKDPETLEAWFSNGYHGLALHIGKSGAIAFDVDEPSRVPTKLRYWMAYQGTPFQSTRAGHSLRGHYLFATFDGVSYGNSKGHLRGEWGEVRGKNGIIAVAPTVHQKADSGGQYKWVRTGALPYLPHDISKLLPKNSIEASLSVDLTAVDSFIRNYGLAELPDLLDIRIDEAADKLMKGSRHDNTLNLLLICLRESMAGLYPASDCIESIAGVFLAHKPTSEWSSPREFTDMVRWAVGQVMGTTQEDLVKIRESQLIAHVPGVKKWLNAQR